VEGEAEQALLPVKDDLRADVEKGRGCRTVRLEDADPAGLLFDEEPVRAVTGVADNTALAMPLVTTGVSWMAARAGEARQRSVAAIATLACRVFIRTSIRPTASSSESPDALRRRRPAAANYAP